MNGFPIPALGALVAVAFVLTTLFDLRRRLNQEDRQVARVRRTHHHDGRR